MLGFGFCCCCTTCVRYHEPFSTTGDISQYPKWEVDSGTWDVVAGGFGGGLLRCTAAGTINCIDVDTCDGVVTYEAATRYSTLASGDGISLIADYGSADRYVYLKIWKDGTGTWARPYTREGGSDTAIGEVKSISATSIDMAIILNGGRVVFYAGPDGSSVVRIWTAPWTSQSDQTAIRVDTLASANIQFDFFNLDRKDIDGCAAWYPEWCTDGLPQEFAVTLSGMANATCTDCAGLDDEFIVALDPLGSDLSRWAYGVSGDAIYVSLIVTWDSIANESTVSVQIDFIHCSRTIWSTYSATFAGEFDCTTFDMDLDWDDCGSSCIGCDPDDCGCDWPATIHIAPVAGT